MLHLNYPQDEKPPGFIISNCLTKVRGVGNADHIRALEKVSGERVEIGDHTIIEMPVKIGNNVKIGDLCKIGPNVSIPDNTTIPDGSIINS